MAAEDRARVAGSRWLDYLDGHDPDYPVEALQGALDEVRQRVAGLRADPTTPDTRLSDDMNSLNPARTERLTELMLGGLPTGRVGYPLHCRLRYFDPGAHGTGRRRAGLPEDVGALVEGMSADETTVSLVNLDPLRARTVVVQGGAYGEHAFTSAHVEGRSVPVAGSTLTVRLEPGCGARLVLGMERYANQPTLAFPWDRE
jgi:hypothetical protein